MNKKDTVRAYLKNVRKNYQFTVISLAVELDIKAKDVQNVAGELLKHGGVSRIKQPDSTMLYTVDPNATALYFAKHPISGKDRKSPNPAPVNTTAPTRRNRPAVVRALDAESHELELRLKEIAVVRKRYIA